MYLFFSRFIVLINIQKFGCLFFCQKYTLKPLYLFSNLLTLYVVKKSVLQNNCFLCVSIFSLCHIWDDVIVLCHFLINPNPKTIGIFPYVFKISIWMARFDVAQLKKKNYIWKKNLTARVERPILLINKIWQREWEHKLSWNTVCIYYMQNSF